MPHSQQNTISVLIGNAIFWLLFFLCLLSARKIETPLKQFHCFRIAQTAPITWRNIEKLLSLSANICFLRLSLDEIRHRPGETIIDLSIKIMFFDVRSTLLKT